MSKHIIDQINRNLLSGSMQYSTGNHKKGLKNVDKACKMAMDGHVVELINNCLLSKGSMLARIGKSEEALETFEEDFSFFYEILLKDTMNSHAQKGIYESIKFSLKLLTDINDPSVMLDFYESHREEFENICRIYANIYSPGSDKFLLADYIKTAGYILFLYADVGKPEPYEDLAVELIDLFKVLFEFNDDQDLSMPFVLFDGYVKACVKNHSVDVAINISLKLQEFVECLDGYDVATSNISIHNFLGACYRIKGEDDRAVEQSVIVSDIASEAFKERDEAAVILEMSSSMLDLGDLLLGAGYFDQAEFYFKEALETAEQIFGLEDYGDYVNEALELFERLAEAFSEFEMDDLIIHCYNDEIRIYEFIRDEELDDPEECDLNIGDILSDIAEIFIEMGNREQAASYFEQGLQIYERLNKDDPGESSYLAYLGGTLNDLGYLYIEKNTTVAQNYFNRALDIFEEIQDPVYSIDHSEALKGLGNLSAMDLDYKTAAEYFVTSTRILEGAMENNPGDKKYLPHLIHLYKNLSELYYDLEDIDMAGQFLSKALDIDRLLLETKSDFVTMQAFVLDGLIRDGAHQIGENRYELALSILSFVLEFCENEYSKDDLSPELIAPAMDAIAYLVRFVLYSGQAEEVVDMRGRFLSLLEISKQVPPEDPEILEKIAVGYAMYGLLCTNGGEDMAGDEATGIFMTLLADIVRQFPDYESDLLDDLASIQSLSDEPGQNGMSRMDMAFQAFLEKHLFDL